MAPPSLKKNLWLPLKRWVLRTKWMLPDISNNNNNDSDPQSNTCNYQQSQHIISYLNKKKLQFVKSLSRNLLLDCIRTSMPFFGWVVLYLLTTYYSYMVYNTVKYHFLPLKWSMKFQKQLRTRWTYRHTSLWSSYNTKKKLNINQ